MSVNSTFNPWALKKPFSCAMYSGASVATCCVPAFHRVAGPACEAAAEVPALGAALAPALAGAAGLAAPLAGAVAGADVAGLAAAELAAGVAGAAAGAPHPASETSRTGSTRFRILDFEVF